MIKLYDGWQIDSDGKCYILQQEGNPDKDGNPTWKNQTYHSTLQRAVEKLMSREQMEVVSKQDMTLAQAVLDLHRLHDKFKALLQEIGEIEKL